MSLGLEHEFILYDEDNKICSPIIFTDYTKYLNNYLLNEYKEYLYILRVIDNIKKNKIPKDIIEQYF